MYFMGMSLKDIETCDVSELKFITNWLIEQKDKEVKEASKNYAV